MKDNKIKKAHEQSLNINDLLQQSRLVQLQDIARKVDALEEENQSLAVENTNLQREIEKLAGKISSDGEKRRT